MNGYREKSTRHNKRQKTQFEETKEASESDTARTLELSDWEFETAFIDMIRALLDKGDHIKEQIGNISREMKTKMMRKDEKEPKRNSTD